MLKVGVLVRVDMHQASAAIVLKFNGRRLTGHFGPAEDLFQSLAVHNLLWHMARSEQMSCNNK